MSLPSTSCWSGLEKKLFWFTENKDFFKKFRVTNTRHGRDGRPPGDISPRPTEPVTEVREHSEDLGPEGDTENIDEDLLNMKVLLVKLKSVLSQVRPEEEVPERTSVVRENELLKKELKLLKLMIRERDTKIKNLENLLNFENELYSNSFTDWSIN